MSPFETVVKFLQEFWISGVEFVAELFVIRDFGFFNIDFLHFFTASSLTLFLGVAIAKWIIT